MTERYADYFKLAQELHEARYRLRRSFVIAGALFGRRSLHVKRLSAQLDSIIRLEKSLHKQYCRDVPFSEVPDCAPTWPFIE